MSALTTYCNINVTIATHCKWLNHRGLPQLQPQYQRMCSCISNKITLLRRPIASSVFLGGDSNRLAQDVCCYSFELFLSICMCVCTYHMRSLQYQCHCSHTLQKIEWLFALNHRGLPQLQPQYQRMCSYVSNKITLLRRPVARSILLGGDSHRLAQDICC